MIDVYRFFFPDCDYISINSLSPFLFYYSIVSTHFCEFFFYLKTISYRTESAKTSFGRHSVPHLKDVCYNKVGHDLQRIYDYLEVEGNLEMIVNYSRPTPKILE